MRDHTAIRVNAQALGWRGGPIGTTAVVKHTVTDDDTAIALGSGRVAVLGTPRVIALCEDATCRAVEDDLEPGQTTVGTEVQLKHVAAVAVGREVRAEATLDGSKAGAWCSRVVSDDSGLVAAGKITRVIVDEKALPRQGAGESAVDYPWAFRCGWP